MEQHESLRRLGQALAELRAERMGVAAFAANARAANALLAGLPPRFSEVLEQLLMRLESSQAFSGDSCSFSRDELLANFELWLERAQLRLADTGNQP